MLQRQNSPWPNHIRSILDQTGYSYVWLNQTRIPTRNISTLVKSTLVDQFQQNCFEKFNNSSKGKMYSLFKSDIKFEEYLNILPKSLRFPLIHFRTSNNKFHIEVGIDKFPTIK